MRILISPRLFWVLVSLDRRIAHLLLVLDGGLLVLIVLVTRRWVTWLRRRRLVMVLSTRRLLVMLATLRLVMRISGILMVVYRHVVVIVRRLGDWRPLLVDWRPLLVDWRPLVFTRRLVRGIWLPVAIWVWGLMLMHRWRLMRWWGLVLMVLWMVTSARHWRRLV